MIPVIIPFYKNRTQLHKCIQHLERQTVPVELFIRDNSTDNIFYTAAVNEGIRHFIHHPAQYRIVLNQDMYLKPDAVAKMVAFMDCHPRCGIGAPLQLYSGNPRYVIWGGSYEAFPVGRHQHGPIELFSTDEPVYWANGACMILRVEMIQDIGLLDNNLRFMGSDCDYSFTARARGWEVWRIAEASGIHEHGASGISNNPSLEALKAHDMLYFAHKWLSGNLYREMAWEGANCLPEHINDVIKSLQRAEQLNRAAAEAELISPAHVEPGLRDIKDACNGSCHNLNY
jgi:GT2 family glycosyltransferase